MLVSYKRAKGSSRETWARTSQFSYYPKKINMCNSFIVRLDLTYIKRQIGVMVILIIQVNCRVVWMLTQLLSRERVGLACVFQIPFVGCCTFFPINRPCLPVLFSFKPNLCLLLWFSANQTDTYFFENQDQVKYKPNPRLCLHFDSVKPKLFLTC